MFLLNEKQRKGESGGSPTNNTLSRLDRNFLTTLIDYTETGHVQYTRAYRLAGVGRSTFENVAERLKNDMK